MTALSEKELAYLPTLYRKTGGKAWEPNNVTNTFFDRATADGFLRRVDGRCGFERLKDAMVEWTPAGHAAFANKEPSP